MKYYFNVGVFFFFFYSFELDFYEILENKGLNILISDDINHHIVLKV